MFGLALSVASVCDVPEGIIDTGIDHYNSIISRPVLKLWELGPNLINFVIKIAATDTCMRLCVYYYTYMT